MTVDRPIQVGDLVQVVRDCGKCNCAALGFIFKVPAIHMSSPNLYCSAAGKLGAQVVAEVPDDLVVYPLSWLKRIPPLSELEGQRTQEDIREPA